jgi:hypothetical protein
MPVSQALLHQLLALQGPKQANAETAVSLAISRASDKNSVNGRTMTYTAFNADDKFVPQEVANGNMQLQTRVADQLKTIIDPLADAWDVELSLSCGNQEAKAPLIFEGKSVFMTEDGKPFEVPSTYLLFLENRLKGLLKQMQTLQTLDPTIPWKFDASTGTYKSELKKKNKMDKVPVVIKLSAATEHHMEGTKVEYADKPIGDIITQHMTGAITPEQHRTLLRRIQAMIDAVLAARYQANDRKVAQHKQARSLLNIILEPITESTPAAPTKAAAASA